MPSETETREANLTALVLCQLRDGEWHNSRDIHAGATAAVYALPEELPAGLEDDGKRRAAVRGVLGRLRAEGTIKQEGKNKGRRTCLAGSPGWLKPLRAAAGKAEAA